MKCETHQDKEAVGFCSQCGRGVCEDCLVELKDTKYCKECKEKIDAASTDSKGRYLVCESCGGNYKLQEGESPKDFDACECGGKLIYTTNPDGIHPSGSKSNDELSSAVNDVTAKIKEGSIIDKFIAYINWKILIIGGLLVIILTLGADLIFTVNWSQIPRILAVLISSAFAGYLLRNKNSAAIHGGLIGLIQVIITFGSIWFMGMGVFPIIEGIIGGIVGALIREKI